ncbi:MAG: FAD-dependent oxidoreductase, partial [Candidatus Aminicenantales bacterium]
MTDTEVLIIGGGPAGLTAGIYSARSGHKTVLLEKQFSGGQMALTSEVENYPGIAEPVSGMTLAQAMEQQATRFGCTILNGEATGIQATDSGFEVRTSAAPIEARTVIICTGVKPRLLGFPNEGRLTGRGVSYCAVCDGPLFHGSVEKGADRVPVGRVECEMGLPEPLARHGGADPEFGILADTETD